MTGRKVFGPVTFGKMRTSLLWGLRVVDWICPELLSVYVMLEAAGPSSSSRNVVRLLSDGIVRSCIIGLVLQRRCVSDSKMKEVRSVSYVDTYNLLSVSFRGTCGCARHAHCERLEED